MDFPELIESNAVLYETNEFVIALHPEPCVIGHCIIVPKNHYNIIEQIPNNEFSAMFVAASKVCTSLFEVLSAQGTNVIIQNGIAAGQRESRACIHIVPRSETDNLPLLWKPKQESEEVMATVELRYKQEFNQSEEKKVEEKKHHVQEIKNDEENYMLKHIRRIA